jgi:hypothetical protein
LAKRNEACSAECRSSLGSASRSGCESAQLPVPSLLQPLPVHSPFSLDLALAVVLDSSALIGRNAVAGMRVVLRLSVMPLNATSISVHGLSAERHDQIDELSCEFASCEQVDGALAVKRLVFGVPPVESAPSPRRRPQRTSRRPASSGARRPPGPSPQRRGGARSPPPITPSTSPHASIPRRSDSRCG